MVEANFLFAILIRWQNNFVISLKFWRQLNFNFLWCTMYIVNRIYNFRFISNKWNITFISFSVLRIKTNRLCLGAGNTRSLFLIAWGNVRKTDVTHISIPWYEFTPWSSLVSKYICLFQHYKTFFSFTGCIFGHRTIPRINSDYSPKHN
jgi:hypothetical protein